jgi:hypothetical protein
MSLVFWPEVDGRSLFEALRNLRIGFFECPELLSCQVIEVFPIDVVILVAIKILRDAPLVGARG